MNELFTRILSGLVYASLIFLGLKFGKVTTVILFLIFGILCLYEVQKLLNFKNYLSYIIYPAALFYFNYFPVDCKIIKVE
jgi:phosphatidate cytidylyltransferase